MHIPSEQDEERRQPHRDLWTLKRDRTRVTNRIAGLLATWWFHRWARRPERAAFGRKMDDSLTGGSLRKALAQLDELERFERG